MIRACRRSTSSFTTEECAEADESGRGEGDGVWRSVDSKAAILSCRARPFRKRSDVELSLRDTERVEELGEAGGGIAMALGSLGRGAVIVRPLEEGEAGIPRPGRPGFGVAKGDPGGRVGEDVRDFCEGEARRAGLPSSRGGLRAEPASDLRELSCWAVIDAYLDAREPSVTLGVAREGRAADLGSVGTRGRGPGVVPGVTRPALGVMRPRPAGVGV
ncbi:hypothetical protein GGG16DRAFT_93538, partial [Schizophyllum commune]